MSITIKLADCQSYDPYQYDDSIVYRAIKYFMDKNKLEVLGTFNLEALRADIEAIQNSLKNPVLLKKVYTCEAEASIKSTDFRFDSRVARYLSETLEDGHVHCHLNITADTVKLVFGTDFTHNIFYTYLHL